MTSKRQTPRPDDRPIGDTNSRIACDIRRENRRDLLEVLHDHFDREPMLFVSADLPIYYDEANPKKRIAPDIFVVRGLANRDRDHYRIWEEGKGPDVVVELPPKSARRHESDRVNVYHHVLKVSELFLMDPAGGCLDAPLRGYRWSSSGYVPIERGRGPGLPSAVLGLNLAREGYALRIFDPETGRKLLTLAEQAAEAESMHLQIEKARRLVSIELDLAETRRQLAENQLVITEAQLQHAEGRIERLEAENARLQEQIERLGAERSSGDDLIPRSGHPPP